MTTEFNLMNVTADKYSTLKGFEPFKEVPLEFIAEYFEGVKGVKRGGKLILDKNVSDKKASEINDVWQFIKKGLVYTSTTNRDDFLYSSHEFGVDLTTGQPIITTTGKAFDSCHFNTHPDVSHCYGSAKKAVLRMFIIFTKDGQYYGRFYIYDGYHNQTDTKHDLIDGVYINKNHTSFKNKNEPRLSALIYSHNNSLKRSQVIKMNTNAEYYGQGYPNPANDHAYYINKLETNTTNLVSIDCNDCIQILNNDDNREGFECYGCERWCDEDESVWVERDVERYCDECVCYCEECEQYFSNEDVYYNVNGTIICEDCMDNMKCN